MAIAVVNKKQTGTNATATLAITKATAGNLLCVFIAQAASVTVPSIKDNVGEAGWTFDGTSSVGNETKNSLYIAYKTAGGSETELTASPGAGGTIEGLSYFELSGASTKDEAAKKENPGLVKTVTSPGLTTTNAGDIVIAAVGFPGAGASGTVKAWTGTGPMTNVETLTTRCIGGYYLPGTTLSGATFTAEWTNERQVEMLVIALKPADSFSGTLLGTTGLRNVLAGAKAAGSALLSKVGVSNAVVGRKVGLGALSQTTAQAAALTGNKRGIGALSSTTAQQASLTGNKIGLSALAQTTAQRASLTGSKTGIGALANGTAQRGVLTGAKDSFGTLVQRVGLGGSLTGSKTSSGVLLQTFGLRGVMETSGQAASGTLLGTFGLRGIVTGNKVAIGPLSGRAALRGQAQGVKGAYSSVAGGMGLFQALAGAKAGHGALTGQIALQGSLTGTKPRGGALIQQIAFIQVLHRGINGIATATVCLRYVAAAEVAVDEADATVQTDRATEEVAI